MKLKNSNRDIAENLEREFENLISARYGRDYHEPPLMSWQAENFVKYVSDYIKPGDRILDLGCASAVLWDHFLQNFPQDISLTGVDLSPNMLDIAAKNFPGGTFKVGSFFSIPAEMGSFDAVIVSSALHHISDRYLPDALKEIHRVLDEHGILIGREPLSSGRLIDKGGWLTGALMHLRHLAYRLSHTREYPEPDPGPDHHAYEAGNFLVEVEKFFSIDNVSFRHPISLLLARTRDNRIVEIGKHLDEVLKHKGGQELYYSAYKNYSHLGDVVRCVSNAIEGNEISKIELDMLMEHVLAAALIIESKLG
jgi:SAM-dependent methyltransferase